MWLFQSIFPSPYRECQRCRGTLSYDNLDSWGSSFPVAILIGLMCAYVWFRIRPFVADHPDERPDSILQDLSEVKAFLSNLQDQVSELLGSKTTVAAAAANGERVSKEGEEILLSKRGRNGMLKGRSFTSEAILGTITIGTHVAKDDIASLAQQLHMMGNGGHVYEVMESCVLLQSMLPITSNLLYQAFQVAKQGIALDPQCTLQLGSWGIIMPSEGDVKCLKLRDGDVPVLLDSTLEGGHELRVEGLFLEGVQMRATTSDKTVVLRNISLVKDAGQMDVLFVKEPIGLIKGSLIYASKIVQFKGIAVVVRSGLNLIGFQPKPQHSNHNGIYLLALLSFIITLLPRQIWWPILGHVGILFLPVLQIAAVVIGWKIGQYIMLGEWPNDNKKYETKFDKQHSLWGSDDIFRLTSPWDSAVRMEMSDLGQQLVQRLEKQPSTSNVGIYTQQPDFRTEFWQKGLVEMDQAIESQPQNATPFRIRGCIKGLAGDYDSALKDLDSALQLRKDDVLALVSRGIFKFLTGDYEGALPDLNQGITHDPAQPSEVIKLRDAITKILAEREELAKLRVENPQLKAELDALQKKAVADLEAMRLKGEADLEAMWLKGEADLEAMRLKGEADLEALRLKDEAELEALRLKSETELETMRLKSEAELEALQLKSEAELEAMRLKVEQLQEDLRKAEELLKKIPQNQTIELQYNNLCCEKCIKDIKGALYKFPGIESVVEDLYNNRVSVTGYLIPSFVLDVCRKTSPTKVISIISSSIDPIAAAAPEPVPESVPAATHDKPDAESREIPKSEPANTPAPESTALSEPEGAPEAAHESKPEVEAEPAPADSKPEVPAAPAPAESNLEVPAAPAPAESNPEVPAAPAPAESNPEVPAAPAPAESTPEVPAAPAPVESNPEVPSAPADSEPNPEVLSTPEPAESNPEVPTAPVDAECNPEVPTAPVDAESNPEVPTAPADAEPNPEVLSAPVPTESNPEVPAAPAPVESKLEDPAQDDSDPAPEPELIPEPKPEPEPEPKQDPSNPESEAKSET